MEYSLSIPEIKDFFKQLMLDTNFLRACGILGHLQLILGITRHQPS